MDYIKGQDMGGCWIHLTAAMIQQLQFQQLVLSQEVRVGVDSSDYGAGTFNSGSEMEAWFNHRLTICKRYNHAPHDIPSFDFHFQKFVLVHQDISPRNMRWTLLEWFGWLIGRMRVLILLRLSGLR